jgi:hypothetical protein
MNQKWEEWEKNEVKNKIKSLEKEYLPSEIKVECDFRNEKSATTVEVDAKSLNECFFKRADKVTLIIFLDFRDEIPDEKEFILRHEFMHIRDALTPEFGYDPDFFHSDKKKKSRTELFFLILVNLTWDIFIDLRLKDCNFKSNKTTRGRVEDFLACFRDRKVQFITLSRLKNEDNLAEELELAFRSLKNNNKVTLKEIKEKSENLFLKYTMEQSLIIMKLL